MNESGRQTSQRDQAKPQQSAGEGKPAQGGQVGQTEQEEQSPQQGSRLILVGVGTWFAATVISGLLLGYWVDAWLDTRPVFMLLFALLGFVGGTLRVHKLLTR